MKQAFGKKGRPREGDLVQKTYMYLLNQTPRASGRLTMKACVH